MLAKLPLDAPSSSGERVYKRGYTPEIKGTIEAFMARNGWVEVIWDRITPNHPKICHLNELVRLPSTA
jgi:hypothetical protein